jgi:endonuclease YncB( thermonuclease family)
MAGHSRGRAHHGLRMIRALLLLLLGAASFVAVYIFVGPKRSFTHNAPIEVSSPAPVGEIETGSVSGDDTSRSEAPPPLRIELRPGAETLPPSDDLPRLVRDVTPDTMTAGPRLTMMQARSAAPSPSPPASPAEKRRERLFNPMVLNAGTLKVRERKIHLAGVTAPEFEAMCGEKPAAWPCGRMARTALQSFIHRRAIECTVPAGAEKIPDPASCQVGGDDISEWLVSQGWAKRSGDRFGEEESRARDAKLGLWSPVRPGGQSTAVASGGG